MSEWAERDFLTLRLDAGGPDALFDGRENVVAGIFETLDAINSGLYDERTSLRVARGKSGGTE